MKGEHIAIMLLEMAGGVILGFMAWSYVAPVLAGQTTTG